MSKYKYKIIDSNNHSREGEVDGESIQQVADSLLAQGFTILDLKPAGFSLEGLKNINVGGVPFKEKVIFMRQMAFMINAGLPLTQCLEIAQSQAQNFQFREIIQSVLKDVQGGIALSKSMDKHPQAFDLVSRNLIKAGEESGKLDMILDRLADDMERQQEFNGKVKGAMIYPIVILAAIVAVVVMLLVFMIPQTRELFANSGGELPFLTRVIDNASRFLTDGPGGIILGLVALAAFGAFMYYRKTPSGKLVTDKILTKLPIFGDLIVKAQIASFAGTFSMLIGAGVPILDALKLVSESTTNDVFKFSIEDARKRVEKGVPLSTPLLNNPVFPQLIGHMAKVGEETGKLDEIISKVGTQYRKEVDRMADNLAKLMEPVILIVMGVIVGLLAVAVYLPIFELGNAITSGS